MFITGHSRGLGAELKRVFENRGKCEVKGFSRSNGYDIESYQDRKKIVNQIKEFDLFINNAFHPIGQVSLLYEVFYKWRYEEKTIINIGSRRTDRNISSEDIYGAYKSALDQSCRNLSLLSRKCKIINFRPGAIDTDFDNEWKIKNDRKPIKMSTTEVANFIFNIFQIQRGLDVTELTFGAIRGLK